MARKREMELAMEAYNSNMEMEAEEERPRGLMDMEDVDEDEDVGSGKLAIVLVSLFIFLIWMGIFGILIHWNVGGLGSLLTPALQNVPVINRILPADGIENGESGVIDVQYPFATVSEAISRIQELEQQLAEARNQLAHETNSIASLEAELQRLQIFEQEQADFHELRTNFFQEVVFSDQAPDINEYKMFYESIDPEHAAELYKQVVRQIQVGQEVMDFARTYSAMRPRQAAAILEQMTDDPGLAVQILQNMRTDARSSILGAMDPQFAAQITRLMDPTAPLL